MSTALSTLATPTTVRPPRNKIVYGKGERKLIVIIVTWDPDYYNKTHDNTTWEVAVRLDYLNKTSNLYEKLEGFDRVPAAWGFWPFYADIKYMKSHNLTVTLLSNIKGSGEKHNSTAMPINLEKMPYGEQAKPSAGKSELTIALPTVLGAIVLIVIGGCLWNRKTRRINLGSVMGRKRGYTGRSARRGFGGRKDNGIQLDTRGVGSPADEYRDAPERPHRGSDDLDSLANSPIDGNFQQQGTNGGRNAFRDEIRRQEAERR